MHSAAQAIYIPRAIPMSSPTCQLSWMPLGIKRAAEGWHGYVGVELCSGSDLQAPSFCLGEEIAGNVPRWYKIWVKGLERQVTEHSLLVPSFESYSRSFNRA